MKKQLVPTSIEKIPHSGFVLRPIYSLLNAIQRETKVAMLHTGRCGSTVLGKMLNSHSEIFWASELFYKYWGGKIDDGYRFAAYHIEKSQKQRLSKIYGFETKYLPFHQLSDLCLDMSLFEYIKLLKDLGFSKFIVLERLNYLRYIISIQIGKERKKLHSNTEITKPIRIHLDTENFDTSIKTTKEKGYKDSIINIFDTMDDASKKLREVLINEETLSLTYENDIMLDPKKAYNKVCKFLSVKNEKPQISLQRTNPFRINEVVTNYKQIREILNDTKYFWMLDI